MADDSGKYRDPLRAIAPAEVSAEYAPGDATQFGCTLHVGTAGNICVDLFRDVDDTKTVFKNVGVGPFPYRIKKIHDDLTTAADIVMVW